MENAKEVAGDKPNAAAASDESPAQSLVDAAAASAAVAARPPLRTPFTSLSQEDADLALARTLQEQEHAYLMLRMGIPAGSDYGSSESGSFVYEDDQGYEYDDDAHEEEYGEEVVEGEEDAFDVHAIAEQEVEEEGEEEEKEDAEEDGGREVGDEIDPSAFESDEAYARALQDAEEREVAIHLMAFARITGWHSAAVEEERGGTSRNPWVDPDEFSYEELVALGDVVGTENRGLSKDKIETLPSVTYKAQNLEDENTEQCVICRLEYDDGEKLVVLPCKHLYHPDCINNWLQINKVCPVCSKEVSVEGNCGGGDARQ